MTIRSKRGSAGLDVIVASAVSIITIFIIASFCYSCYRIESNNRKILKTYEIIENHMMAMSSDPNWDRFHQKSAILAEDITAKYTVVETVYNTTQITVDFIVINIGKDAIIYTFSMERSKL